MSLSTFMERQERLEQLGRLVQQGWLERLVQQGQLAQILMLIELSSLVLVLKFLLALSIAVQFVWTHFQQSEFLQWVVATQRALLQAKRRLANNSFAPKIGQVAFLESHLKPIMASLLFSIAQFVPLAFTRVQSIFRQLGFSLMTLTASMVRS